MISFEDFCKFCKDIKGFWEYENYLLKPEDIEEEIEFMNYDAISKYAGHLISNNETVAASFAKGFWEFISETEAEPYDCLDEYWPYFIEYATEEDYKRERNNPIMKAQMDAFYQAAIGR